MKKPFYKASHKAWYVLLFNEEKNKWMQVKLAKDYDEALIRYGELLKGERSAITLKQLVVKFLDWVGRNRAKETQLSYGRMLNRWAAAHGSLSVSDIRPLHVDEILRAKFAHCGKTSHWQFCKAAVVCLNWAKAQGLIDTNPLAGMKKPQCGVRQVWFTQEQFDKLLSGSDDEALTTLRYNRKLWTGV
jgi:hypothetical protein